MQKFIKDLSQAQKYTQVNTITNTALGAAIQIPMMMEVPEGQVPKTALLDDDSPDCWIGTSTGSRFPLNTNQPNLLFGAEKENITKNGQHRE